MKILAIETSCDETAAAVVEDGRKVLSSAIYSQIEEHKIYGGVVPEIASRRHVEQVVAVTRNALDNAGTGFDGVDAVAVTAAPGLIGALLVGVNFAKGLSLALDKPLIPVHHLRGHVAANYIQYPGFAPPFLCLIVSGGHSHIVEVTGYTSYRIIGKTRDDAAGEAFDKVARVLGLPYPGGVSIDNAAKKGDKSAFSFPKPKVDGNPLDLSFSGLKTAVVNTAHHLRQMGRELLDQEIYDMAASFQETVCDMLTGRFIAAAKNSGHKRLALSGGVSANSRLRETLGKHSRENGFELYMPPLSLCGDNAAMIGSQAYYEFSAGNTADLSLNAYPTYSVEKPF